MALSWILNRGAAKDDVAVQGELAHFERATLPMGYNGSNPVYNPSGTLTGTGSNGIGTGGEEDLITYHTS
jgi:hypothetical protein